MSELRWILIVCGAVLLAGIYFWGRRSSRQSPDRERVPLRPEPQLAAHDAAMPERLAYEEEATYDVEPVLDQDPLDLGQEPAAPAAPDLRRGRVEPTFSEFEPLDSGIEEPVADSAVTEELPVREPQAAPAAAPTLSMSDTPAPRRIERRKIIALRLAAASDRFAGPQLRQALEAERLEHGKYDVFHRLHQDGSSIFSIASMVEPGTFDLEKMAGLSYPGITLFAQLPGPLVGVQALHDLVACGKRLQEILGGTLQDERGVPLTVHRIDRLRQEIVEFERAPGREAAHRSPVSPPAH